MQVNAAAANEKLRHSPRTDAPGSYALLSQLSLLQHPTLTATLTLSITLTLSYLIWGQFKVCPGGKCHYPGGGVCPGRRRVSGYLLMMLAGFSASVNMPKAMMPSCGDAHTGY